MNQYKLQGRMVNVPTDVQNSISVLPRLPNETDVIPVLLKRKRIYHSYHISETIQPRAIKTAVELLKNSEVYKQYNIKIDVTRTNFDILNENANCDHDTEIDNIQSDGNWSDSFSDDDFMELDLQPLVNMEDNETLMQKKSSIHFCTWRGKYSSFRIE